MTLWQPFGASPAPPSGSPSGSPPQSSWLFSSSLTGRRVFTYRGHSSIVDALAWSPYEECIASVADDVQVWQAI